MYADRHRGLDSSTVRWDHTAKAAGEAPAESAPDARNDHDSVLTESEPTARRKPMTSGRASVKRYNLVLPEELFNQIQEVADRQQTTVAYVLRRFIKLGLLATHVEAHPDSALIIREGDTDTQIVFL